MSGTRIYIKMGKAENSQIVASMRYPKDTGDIIGFGPSTRCDEPVDTPSPDSNVVTEKVVVFCSFF